MSMTNAAIEQGQIVVDEATLHYTVAGQGRPLVLIHGFPQCRHQWTPIIARLASQFRIIAPDLRGLGGSPGPTSGYDKHTLAGDIRQIVLAEVGDQPALICGHDMGSFVAFAYALRYRDAVERLMLIDAPPPGTAIWDAGVGSPRAWHIAFHAQIDVAQMLISGREREYITHFIRSRAYDVNAITQQDLDIYIATYSAPGALRAALSMYRALLFEDPTLNRTALAAGGKLEMPVMLVGGSLTIPRQGMELAAAEIATDFQVEMVDRSGHWISEEQPEQLAWLLRRFAAGDGA